MDTVWFLCPSMLTRAPLTARPSIRVVPLFGPFPDDTMDRTEVADITTPPTVTFRLLTEAVESTSSGELMVAGVGGSAPGTARLTTGQTSRPASITASTADAEQRWFRRSIRTSLR